MMQIRILLFLQRANASLITGRTAINRHESTYAVIDCHEMTAYYAISETTALKLSPPARGFGQQILPSFQMAQPSGNP